jgi:hypothetical protein
VKAVNSCLSMDGFSMNKNLAALATVLFSCYSFASGTKWILVSGTGAANEYIDFSTIERKGGTVSAWVLGDLEAARPFKGQYFRSLKTKVEFDCSGRRFRQVHATLYSGPMGSGSVLESGYVSNPWELAVPQSVGQSKLLAVCQR